MRVVESRFCNALAELTSIEEGIVSGVLVIGLANFQRSPKGIPDLNIKPFLERPRHKPPRNEEEKQCRDQREGDEGQDQTDPETRPKNPLSPFEDELDQISDHKKNKKNEQDDIYVQEEKKRDIVGG